MCVAYPNAVSVLFVVNGGLLRKLAVLCVLNGGLFCVAGDVLCNLAGLCGVNGGLFSVAGDVLCNLAGLCSVNGGLFSVAGDVLCKLAGLFGCLPLLVLSNDGGTRLKCVHTIVHISSREVARFVMAFLEIIGQWVAIWSSTYSSSIAFWVADCQVSPCTATVSLFRPRVGSLALFLVQVHPLSRKGCSLSSLPR